MPRDGLPATPKGHVALALAKVGRPHVTGVTHGTLEHLARQFDGTPQDLQRVLRHLLVSGPDNQLC